MDVATRLKEERARLKLTQQQFAELGGVSDQTQLTYEKGRTPPNAQYLAALKDAGVDVTYILNGRREGALQTDKGEGVSTEAGASPVRLRQPTPVIKILVADDHALILEGLKGRGFSHHGISIASTTSNPTEVIGLYEREKPDVVILDIRFLSEDIIGLAICEELLAKHPGARVIIYSQFDDIDLIKAAYGMGALAFVPKENTDKSLIEAIQQANNGDIFVPPKIGETLLRSSITTSDASPKELLNSAEISVFKLMALGKGLIEISKINDISLREVNTISENVKNKLRVFNTTEIRNLALKHHIIDLVK